VPQAVREFLESAGVIVISAHLPFKPVGKPAGATSEMIEVGEALGLWARLPAMHPAVLVACDAGAIAAGDRVMAVSATLPLWPWPLVLKTFFQESRAHCSENRLPSSSAFYIQARECDAKGSSIEGGPGERIGSRVALSDAAAASGDDSGSSLEPVASTDGKSDEPDQ